nr:zinc-binding dehydrogenase [Pseudomonas sp.]
MEFRRFFERLAHVVDKGFDPGGLATIRRVHSLAPLPFRGATYSAVFTLLPLLTGKGREHHGEILREAAQLIEGGQLKPLLDLRQFTLQTAEAAHELLVSGAAQGRSVVEI